MQMAYKLSQQDTNQVGGLDDMKGLTEEQKNELAIKKLLEEDGGMEANIALRDGMTDAEMAHALNSINFKPDDSRVQQQPQVVWKLQTQSNAEEEFVDPFAGSGDLGSSYGYEDS